MLTIPDASTIVSYISSGLCGIFLGTVSVAVQHLRGWSNTRRPPLLLARPRLPPILISSINSTQQLWLINQVSNKQSKMSRYTIKDNTNCLNTTNSINVQNYINIADDRSQLLTWLSPLEPSLRHRNVRERRVDDIGEWLIQSEEFGRWRGLSAEGECESGVLFCCGAPGVGKTFIR